MEEQLTPIRDIDGKVVCMVDIKANSVKIKTKRKTTTISFDEKRKMHVIKVKEKNNGSISKRRECVGTE